MELDKIYLALSDNYRKALIAVAACVLIFYPIAYFGFAPFKGMDWHTQLLILSGVSAAYVGTFATWYMPVLKHPVVFILSVALAACCACGELLNFLYGNGCQIEGFAFRMVFFSVACWVLLLTVTLFLNRKKRRKGQKGLSKQSSHTNP